MTAAPDPATPPEADATLTAALSAAMAAHTAGRLAEARTRYAALLDDPASAGWPGRVDVQRLLGLAQAGSGAPDLGEATLRAALVTQPGFAPGWSSLGDLLASRPGRAEAAIDAYRQALALQPKDPAGLGRLGALLLAEDRGAEAIPVYRRAMALAPEDAAIRRGMGRALLAGGKTDAAVSALLKARALDPGLTGVSLPLGQALSARGNWAGAVGVLRAAVAERPSDVAAVLALARALLALDQAAKAASVLGDGLALRPGDAALQAMVGRVLLAHGRPAAALVTLRHVLAARPRPAEALLVAGHALRALGRPAEAIASLDSAAAQAPDLAEVRHTAALARLSQGDYAGGWPGFALRLHADPAPPMETRLRHPVWTGEEDLAGRQLFLFAERSLEDTLQFLRYLPAVTGLGAQVVLRVQPALHGLVAAMPALIGSPDIVLVPPGDPLPAFDLRCALADLPGAFATTLPTVPCSVPYLAPPPALHAQWADALPAGEGPRIGLIWTASRPRDRLGMPAAGLPMPALERLLDALEAAGPARLHALGPGAESPAAEAAVLDRFAELIDLRPASPDAANLAAALACMDLVLAVDGPALHLAGALGRPVWAMLPEAAEWRWLIGRDDSPWYPTARLFRNERGGDWSGVIARIAEALAKS